MMKKVTYYHAGCPVCVEAESKVVDALDKSRFDVQVVHLGTDNTRIEEAEAQGIKSVPALVIDGIALHINYGASIEALK